MRGSEIAQSAICAALYAVTGYLVHLFLPITTPGIGIVRFWPNVVIPAVFAVLFSPLVGGLGAAMGIFVSDMLIHGDPILSLCAGVPSNFLGFYLIGYVSRKRVDWTKLIAVSTTAIVAIAVGSLATISYIALPQVIENRLMNQTDFDHFMAANVTWMVNGLNLFTGILVIVSIVAIGIGFAWPRWRNYQLGSMIGLGIGSVIIGFVVWGYSQVFVLPSAVGGGSHLPFYASLLWLLWTFATEIPFLILLGPPILEACYRAFPALKPKQEE